MFDIIFVVGPQWAQEILRIMLWYAVEFAVYYCCIGVITPITTRNKAMPSLSYRVKVSRYITICTSDHLY